MVKRDFMPNKMGFFLAATSGFDGFTTSTVTGKATSDRHVDEQHYRLV